MTNQNDPAITAEIDAAPLVIANDGLGFLHAFHEVVSTTVEAIVRTDGAFNAIVLTHDPQVFRGVVTGIVSENRIPHIRIRGNGQREATLIRVWDVLTLAVL